MDKIAPTRHQLGLIYGALWRHFGPSAWWPAETPFEVIIGAILTQAVSWTNVEQAMANLKADDLLTPAALAQVPEEQLAALIRPSGYYRAKTRKIKAFIEFLATRYGGSLDRFFALTPAIPVQRLREELLAVYGIGPETADSILLYAGGLPIFVVDAYTSRIGSRLNLFPARATYAEIQGFFMTNLPSSARLFNEYHALLVRLGKDYCHKGQPVCGVCPLNHLCPQPDILFRS